MLASAFAAARSPVLAQLTGGPLPLVWPEMASLGGAKPRRPKWKKWTGVGTPPLSCLAHRRTEWTENRTNPHQFKNSPWSSKAGCRRRKAGRPHVITHAGRTKRRGAPQRPPSHLTEATLERTVSGRAQD